MLIRCMPPNMDEYIGFADDMNKKLQETGKFLPQYYWNGLFYYLLTNDLMNFIKEGE